MQKLKYFVVVSILVVGMFVLLGAAMPVTDVYDASESFIPWWVWFIIGISLTLNVVLFGIFIYLVFSNNSIIIIRKKVDEKS